MGRNKLSPSDRIKSYVKKPEDLLNEGNAYKISCYINTIRSKVLRDLCIFNWEKANNYTFEFNNTIKEISKGMKMSERKVYDLIKVTEFIGSCGDVGFKKTIRTIQTTPFPTGILRKEMSENLDSLSSLDSNLDQFSDSDIKAAGWTRDKLKEMLE